MTDQPMTIRFVKTRKWGELTLRMLENRRIPHQEVEPGLIEFNLEGYIPSEIIDTIARLGEHNRQLTVNHEAVEWWTAFSWTSCYSRSHLKPIPAYCYNPKREKFLQSVWGCTFHTPCYIHHTARWENWGWWDNKYTRWIFYKDKIWNELVSASAPYHLCPHFNLQRMQAVWSVFPEYVELPDPADFWEIRQSVVNTEGRSVVGMRLGLNLEKLQKVFSIDGLRYQAQDKPGRLLKDTIEFNTLEDWLKDKAHPDYRLLIQGIKIKDGRESTLYNRLLYDAEELVPDLAWPREMGFPKV